MRYRETGRLHMDFYRTLNGTIEYISGKYGRDFLDSTLRNTALNVYREIHDRLRGGSCRELAEHWEYFLRREGGEFTLVKNGGGVVLSVERCPAVHYLKSRKIEISRDFCRQTVEINRALSENTPFIIETRLTGEGACVQTVNRRSK